MREVFQLLLEDWHIFSLFESKAVYGIPGSLHNLI